jgi:6-phosphogluconolactonase (cycloisomerase 2 family)
MAERCFFITRRVLVIVAVAIVASVAPKLCTAEDNPGAVYVLTNQKAGNSVLVYARAEDGTLSFSGSFSTGGRGAGTGADPLGSQGSLVLGRWHRLLFAVNAGSNDVSVFAVDGLQLTLLDREPSGGTMPVSVAVNGDLLYVLNAGGTPNIQGFFIDLFTSHLLHLPGSERDLAGGAGSAPAQVSFSPDGDVLVVTEKSTNQIDSWTVDDDGFVHDRTLTHSSGATPFGFAFARRDFAIVSEAGPSALSSYEVDDDADLELMTASLSDGQKANCWVVVTKNQHYAYTTNTASGNISSYLISKGGFLNLLSAIAANNGTGTAPIDMALSADSHFLYVREATKGKIDGFRIESDGSLTPVGSASGVPAGAQGVAAR